MNGYVPDRGDVVWLNFTPQAGHQQAGHRPALVLSRLAYNSKTGLMLCCPITNQVKGYPFEVSLGSTAGVKRVVLADQVKSLDWPRVLPHVILLPIASSTLSPRDACPAAAGARSSSFFHVTSSTEGRLLREAPGGALRAEVVIDLERVVLCH